MTSTELEALHALWEKATNGSWWVLNHPVTSHGGVSVFQIISGNNDKRVAQVQSNFVGNDGNGWDRSNADLICALKNAFPALHAELVGLRAENARLTLGIQKWLETHDDQPLIEACDARPSAVEWLAARDARLRSEGAAAALKEIGLPFPKEVIEHLTKLGIAEWGTTKENTDEEHLSDFKDTLAITRQTFSLEEKTTLSGVFLEGTSTVLCHTGNSPNGGMTARIIAALWNWAKDQAEAAKLRLEAKGE